MAGIGKIIQHYRNALEMTRQGLAENICTEKYIYLIEKGDRTPSSDLLRLLSDKLGVIYSTFTSFSIVVIL